MTYKFFIMKNSILCPVLLTTPTHIHLIVATSKKAVSAWLGCRVALPVCSEDEVPEEDEEEKDHHHDGYLGRQ